MPENIAHIAKWKEYSFLGNVWTRFNEFNETVEGDEKNNHYFLLCDQVIDQTKGDKNVYTDFCMKLLRNLGHHSPSAKYFDPNHERCNILYNWIYNTKKDDIHLKNIIDKCFDDYNSLMKYTKSKNRCSHISHDNTYVEPIKISILNIFDANMGIIKETLAQVYNSTSFPSQKYVCECVKLYNDIKKEHCTEVSGIDSKRDKTCQRLEDFKTIYMEYIYKKLEKNDKIPSLEDVEVEYIRKCQKNQGIPPLTSSVGGRAPEYVRLATTVRGKQDGSLMSEEINNGDRANSLSPTVSTALGTVAGASSLLALLYKFSTARQWVHSGIRGNRGRINNDLYAEGPNELLFQGFESEDMSSYNARYNIGYGSV